VRLNLRERLVKLVIRLIVSALSLGVAAYVVPGIHVDSLLTLFVAAFLLGIVNAVIRPVLFILTLPITVLTLGLFLLFVNAASLGIVAWLLPGFSINGVGSAILGWLILSVTSWLASRAFVEKPGASREQE
jgi:putative membrane protein